LKNNHFKISRIDSMTVVSLNIASFFESIFNKKSYPSLNFEALIEIMKEGVEPLFNKNSYA